MASRTSTSSYRSARYSTSSSYREEGPEPGYKTQMDPASLSVFREEQDAGRMGLTPYSLHHRESLGCMASVPPGRPASMGAVHAVGDSYSVSADVSQFEPPDVVVMAYAHHIVIHAEKVADDGSVSDTFMHKSQLPEDMDPLSLSSTLTADGMLVVSVRKKLHP